MVVGKGQLAGALMKCISAKRGIVLLIYLHSISALSYGELTMREEKGGDFCDTETFQAECSEDEVIIMNRALYGRMRKGRCVEYELGYINCSTDVLTRIDRRCSGRRTCDFRIPDAEFESTGPCIKELKTYLEVGYYCVQVDTSSADYCSVHSFVNLSLPSGYIASEVPQSNDRFTCDHTLYPWIITVHRGQHINFTLYDFALDYNYGSNMVLPSSSADDDGLCRQYGWLEDSGSDRPVPICGGERVRQIYLSRGNVVKIWTVAGEIGNEPKRFIIRYLVIGCPDPEILPGHTWFERSVDGFASFRCHNNEDLKWIVECVDNTWTGHIGNCSVAHQQTNEEEFMLTREMTMPYGLAIGIGAVIGVLIALVIVLIIGCKSRSDRETISQKRSSMPLNYFESHYDKAAVIKCSCGFLNQVSSTMSPTSEPTTAGTNLVSVESCKDYRFNLAHQPCCPSVPHHHFHEPKPQLQQPTLMMFSDSGQHRPQLGTDRIWESHLPRIDSIQVEAEPRTLCDVPDGVFTVLTVLEANSRAGITSNPAFVTLDPLEEKSSYSPPVFAGIRQGEGAGGVVEPGGETKGATDETRGNSGEELRTAVIKDCAKRCVDHSPLEKCYHQRHLASRPQPPQQQQQRQFNL